MGEPLTRLVLRLAYDGTDFHGFAESVGVRTVAGELRAVVAKVTRCDAIDLRGASRTDAGVHALDQCVRIEVASAIGAAELGRAISALVPPDLEITAAHPAPEGFDPTRDALEKLYLYRIWNARPAPVLARRRVWEIAAPLDLEAMRASAACLVGTNDFAAFRTRSKGEPENTVRTVRAVDLRTFGAELAVSVIGDGFLYRMVRNLVGTLVEVGRGARPPESVAETLASRDRRTAGPSAPAPGLHLVRLRYPGEPPCEVRDEPLRF